MHWIVSRQKERENIFNYFPEVKSIIALGINYFTGRAKLTSQTSKISNYALGDDYHKVLKKRLKNIFHL